MTPYQMMTSSCGHQQVKYTFCKVILKSMFYYLWEGGSADFPLSQKDSLYFRAILAFNVGDEGLFCCLKINQFQFKGGKKTSRLFFLVSHAMPNVSQRIIAFSIQDLKSRSK